MEVFPLSHKVEILSVGTELLLGSIANTDAQMLSQGLSALGLNVYWHTVVGDNPQRAREAVAIAKQRADIIITTGGLGPTCDDLTKNVLAEAFGKKLYRDEDSVRRLEEFAKNRGRKLTENNYQQAMLPEGCTVLVNDWGSAPGCAFEAEGVHVIMLPGPPSECRPMFQYRAVPYLQQFSEGVIASHTLKLFGIGESAMEYQLREKMNAMTNPTLAPYAKEGECELRVTAKAATQEEAQALLLGVRAACHRQGRHPGGGPGPAPPHRGQAEGALRASGVRGGRALPGVCGGGAAERAGPHPGHRRELHRRPHGQAAHRPLRGLPGVQGGHCLLHQ